MMISKTAVLALVLSLGGASFAQAQDAEELAKDLSNPVADLISVPFQLNYDDNIGPDDGGSRWTLNIQPVIPFSLNDDWNLISRTILPVVSTDGLPPGSGTHTGLADTVQSFFFSPKDTVGGGWIVGAGPAFLVPTSTDDRFGVGEWGAGVTGVVLRQSGPWTYGGLANHIWDVSGDTDISSTFMQPFMSYTTPEAWTFTLNSESTYDWESEEWSVPLNGVVTKVVQFGDQPVSFGGGIRYWADPAPNGPEGWGARFIMTFLFPA
ncbi:transporter [Amaricoccus tamworthensis]|uniref:transporter n=1 Tax=Amaricoccus tamworthensis TaxID=57002 RepID=UPI003C7EAAB1